MCNRIDSTGGGGEGLLACGRRFLWRETAMEVEVKFELGHSFRILDYLEASLLRWQYYVQLFKRDSRSVVVAR